MPKLSRKIVETLVGDWADLMTPFMASEKMDKILGILGAERTEGRKILPEQAHIFRAFLETQLKDVRVIIMGIDPYPSAAHATGIAFSIPKEQKLTVTLDYMYRAIEKDVYAGLDLKGDPENRKGDLTYLTKQGVMLTNFALTTQEGYSKMYMKVWPEFTHYFLSSLQFVTRGKIFVSLGEEPRAAMDQEVNTFSGNHFRIHESHPVAAAHAKQADWETTMFSRINAIIIANRLGEPIKW